MNAPVLPQLPELDVLLHEPARLRLLALLSVVRRADFTFLLKQTGLSRGNLSVQMGRLGDAGLIEIEKTFQGNRPRTVYHLTPNGEEALRNYKRSMAEILAALPD